MWHQQVGGTQVSGQYFFYMAAVRRSRRACGYVENGKSHRQSFFPGAADRSVMRSMPHLLKRGTAVSSGEHRKGHLSRGPHAKESKKTRCDPWGTVVSHHTCPQVIIEGKSTLKNLVALTLLTGFGILDVGYGFGAQRPDRDSQLQWKSRGSSGQICIITATEQLYRVGEAIFKFKCVTKKLNHWSFTFYKTYCTEMNRESAQLL